MGERGVCGVLLKAQEGGADAAGGGAECARSAHGLCDGLAGGELAEGFFGGGEAVDGVEAAAEPVLPAAVEWGAGAGAVLDAGEHAEGHGGDGADVVTGDDFGDVAAAPHLAPEAQELDVEGAAGVDVDAVEPEVAVGEAAAVGRGEGLEHVGGGALDLEGVHAAALSLDELVEGDNAAGVAEVGRDHDAAPLLVEGVGLDGEDVGVAEDGDRLESAGEAAGVEAVLGELEGVDEVAGGLALVHGGPAQRLGRADRVALARAHAGGLEGADEAVWAEPAGHGGSLRLWVVGLLRKLQRGGANHSAALPPRGRKRQITRRSPPRASSTLERCFS